MTKEEMIEAIAAQIARQQRLNRMKPDEPGFVSDRITTEINMIAAALFDDWASQAQNVIDDLNKPENAHLLPICLAAMAARVHFSFKITVFPEIKK